MTDPKGTWSDGGKVWNGEPVQGATICQHCQATVLSTSQPERMDDPFNRKQVEAVCRAVCVVEGVDPDSDVYGDGCDPQWSRYADAVAATLAATPAVGGELEALARTLEEAARHKSYWSTDDSLLVQRAVAALRAAQPASPLRGRDIEEALERFAQRADILPKTARDDTTVHFRLRDCRAARAALSASPPEQPAAASLERLHVEKLARHFRVSVAQAKAAQDDIGFMYRELARAGAEPFQPHENCNCLMCIAERTR